MNLEVAQTMVWRRKNWQNTWNICRFRLMVNGLKKKSSKSRETVTLCRERLDSWGLYLHARTDVARPALQADLKRLLKAGRQRHILAYGRGLSYGDACLNRNQITVKFDDLSHVISFNVERGILICEAGITLTEINRMTLPHGWFIPVTPGTSYPTLGGCFAADVHGKNHHHAGSISNHVRWIELVTAVGKVIRCSGRTNADLFRTTAGGMGLTGLIYRLSLKLKRVNSVYIRAEHVRVRNLREMMETLHAGDSLWDYSVSWIDCAAGGLDLGRGEVAFGRHAEPDELPFNSHSKPFDIPSKAGLELPCTPPLSLVSNLTTRLFNELYIRRGGSRRKRTLIVPYDKFFYPLDMVRAWNRLYGRSGFIQYQFVVPFDAGYGVVRKILETCLKTGHIPSLAVLKRLGPGNGLLSFTIPGWTLAIDLPVKPGLLPMLDEFDRSIIDHGGRVYLAKDARLSSEAFRAMYPEFPRWLSIKRKVDPEDLFSSDMSRRLRMSTEEAN